MVSVRGFLGCLAVAGLVVLALGSTAGDSATSAPDCGGVITASTRLTVDIGPCVGDGLVIAGDNITLNLGGTTIRGASGAFTTGIAIYGNNDVVTNGSVTGFATGVAVSVGFSGYDAALGFNDIARKITSFGNTGDGFSAGSAYSPLLDHVTSYSNGTGVTFYGGHAGGNVPLTGLGVGNVTASSFTLNDGDGLNLVDHDVVALSSSSFSNNGANGVYMGSGGTGATLDDVTMDLNHGWGILCPYDCGVTATNSRARQDALGGFGLFWANVTLTGNTAKLNGGDGFSLYDYPTIVAHLGNNIAVRNVGYGINAQPGTTDLGGNTAQGNTASPQCLNVVCG